MKKLLIAAATAALLPFGAMADISITGDAHVRYANNESKADGSEDSVGQRIRLHVTGKSGDTTVNLGLRNDGATRVSKGLLGSDSGGTEGSTTGNADDETAQLNTDYLYLTTKVGPVSIKYGDWWDTMGVGIVQKGVPNADSVEFSIPAGGWTLSAETGAGRDYTTLGATGEINGWHVDIDHDTADKSDANAAGHTDIRLKGKIGPVGTNIEWYDNSEDADAYLIHLNTKMAGIVWHLAYANFDGDNRQLNADACMLAPNGMYTDNGKDGGTACTPTYANDRPNQAGKFAPLGMPVFGSAPGVHGNWAITDVNKTDPQDRLDRTLVGVRADMKFAGMGVQVAVADIDLELPNGDEPMPDKSKTAKSIVVTQPLGAKSNLKVIWGEFLDSTTAGAEVNVKF